MASALGSTFARTYAGHTGVDPYTTAVSDVYQDSSARASSPARACTTWTRSRRRSTGACRRTRCSRTTCSKGSTRGRRSCPTSRSSTTTRRACSRTRGASIGGCAATGRSCSGCSRWCRTRHGVHAQPAAADLPLEDRRQPAPQSRRTGDRRAASRGLDGAARPALGLDARGTRHRRLPALSARGRSARRARAGAALVGVLADGGRQPPHGRGSVRRAPHVPRQSGREHGARDRRHARAARRLRAGGCSSGRRPRASRSASGRAAACSSRRWWRARRSRPGALLLVLIRRPSAWAIALPFVVLWSAAPLIAYWLSRPTVRRPPLLSDADRQYLLRRRAVDVALLRRVRRPPTITICRPTTCSSRPSVASRDARRRPTSAMALLSTLAAYDLGFIDVDALVTRIVGDAHDARIHGALRRALAELVRHARRSRRCSPRMSRRSTAGISPARSSRWPRACAKWPRPARRRRPTPPDRRSPPSPIDRRASSTACDFGFLYDRTRQLFSIGYRLADADGAGPSRRLALRPARLRGASRELPGDRQGRRARDALVPSRPIGDERPRRARPRLVERDRFSNT